MSIKLKTVVFIYSGRLYAALIGILLIPLVIKEVGYEAYGLVGVFAVVQACLNILDAGIGGVLVRQSIVSKTDKKSYSEFISIFNKIIKIFVLVSLATLVIGALFSYHFSVAWLQSTLPDSMVVYCTFSMFAIFAARYIQGPYRSIMLSNEQHGFITLNNVLYITLSQPVALLFLIYVNDSILTYFIIQICAALVSSVFMVVMGEKSKRKVLAFLPDSSGNQENKVNVRDLIYFALQLSILSILWIVVNQSDKLTLTAAMPLEEYTFYSVAFSITMLLTVLSDPINQILLPRMTLLLHEKGYEEFEVLFKNAFAATAVIVISLSLFMVFNGESFVYVWSGDIKLAEKVNLYLPWIFIGSSFYILSNFCFLLRYSFGDLKLHTIIYAIFGAIIIPSNIYIGINYLGVGAASLYALSSIVLFMSWTGFNFWLYFKKGLNLITLVVLPIGLISFSWFYLMNSMNISFDNRIFQFTYLVGQGIGCVLLSFLFIYMTRKTFKLTLKNIKYSTGKGQKGRQ